MDMFRIDDLLDFSNDEIFTSSSSTTSTTSAAVVNTITTAADTTQQLFHQPQNNNNNDNNQQQFQSLNNDFTDDLSVPSDDVAELEWLSRFVDDSFFDFPKDSISGTLTARSESSMMSAAARGRGKRSKAATNGQTISGGAATTWTWTSTETGSNNSRVKRETLTTAEGGGGGGVRRCTHCASEKTPQWRTGPLGPKTLCNACGVRFKSGRLVPEYRPASSPTFVLTQHSNSHRKVMELRRQKEMLRQQQQHHRNFEIC